MAEKEMESYFEDIIKSFLNQPIDESLKRATERGWTRRIKSIDGIAQIGTCDMKSTRLNFTVENGLISEVTLG